MRRGAFPVLAALLLVVIAVAASVLLYLWITSEVGGEEGLVREMVKIEGVDVVESGGRTIFLVYVRNAGDVKIFLRSAYLVEGSSSTPLSIGYASQSPPLWGGDVYWIDNSTGTVAQMRSGLLLYEDFRDGYDSSQWVVISTLESWQGESGSIEVDPTYGLVLTIDRPGTSGTEKYGLRLRDPLTISDGEFVAELEMIKLSGIDRNYLVEVYFSQYATTGNPHFLDQFAAVYINGWYPPITYSTATMEKRDRYGKEWSYQVASYQSEGTWELRFALGDDKIRVYYGGSYAGYLMRFSDSMYTRPYVYLDVGVWSGESGTYSVAFPYLKVYDSPYVNVTGLNPGWEVLILDRADSVVASKTSTGYYLLFGRDELGGYPLEGRIVVLTGVSDVEEAEIPIEPGEVKVVAAAYDGVLSPGTYLIKVATSRGSEAAYAIYRR